MPPAPSKQISANSEPGTLSSSQVQENGDNDHFPPLLTEEEELVEQDIRERFKRMCEGYFDNVCKKLIIELKVQFIIMYLNLLMRGLTALARARQTKS